ncbi:DNA-binding protein, partial [Herbaspirillum sp. HC18]
VTSTSDPRGGTVLPAKRQTVSTAAGGRFPR